MSSFKLKMIAIISMLIDHIGVIIFPELIGLRIIGRLAFPLFSFLITEGYRWTSDLHKYFLRLVIFSLISQYPFWIAFGFDSGLNIFFTLTIGLLAIYSSEKYDNEGLVLILAAVAEIIRSDYGFFGVLLIYLIHRFRDDFSKMIIYIASLYGVIYLLSGFLAEQYSIYYYIQLFALISFVFIKYYNGEQGIKLKYFFYLFYPVHLFILGWFF
ncbi:MAG: TraX family protein [Bacillota bacterium]